MVSTLRKLLNNIFDHNQEHTFYPPESKPSPCEYETSPDMSYTNQSNHLSIQRKKQLFTKNHVSDTNRKQYLENLVDYDTKEYIGISKHVTIQSLSEHKKDVSSKNENLDSESLLKFHCVYCHLLKVLLYHPIKYKSYSAKMVNAINEYCKEYTYLSNKLGKSLNYILLNAEEDVSKHGLIKNGYGVPSCKSETTKETNGNCETAYKTNSGLKKISVGKLNYLINNLEVNTADLYAYEHEFNVVTGEDVTLSNIIRENEKNLKIYCETESPLTNNDKINAMLNWVIEDCYTLFMPMGEKEEDGAEKASFETFNYDCTEALEELKEDPSNTNTKVSLGKQVWLERRKKQYEHYCGENKKQRETPSCLSDNGIRPISYLKIYELLVTGISIKHHFNLADFMVICFVGWMHDGKWEDGIRA